MVGCKKFWVVLDGFGWFAVLVATAFILCNPIQHNHVFFYLMKTYGRFRFCEGFDIFVSGIDYCIHVLFVKSVNCYLIEKNVCRGYKNAVVDQNWFNSSL